MTTIKIKIKIILKTSLLFLYFKMYPPTLYLIQFTRSVLIMTSLVLWIWNLLFFLDVTPLRTPSFLFFFWPWKKIFFSEKNSIKISIIYYFPVLKFFRCPFSEFILSKPMLLGMTLPRYQYVISSYISVMSTCYLKFTHLNSY